MTNTATKKDNRTSGMRAVEAMLDDIMELGLRTNIVTPGIINRYGTYETCRAAINNAAKKKGYPLKATVWYTNITVRRTDM